MDDPGARRREIRDGVRKLAAGGYLEGAERQGVTSDLTIDESLILHSIGWEPVELVCGASTYAVPPTLWNWGSGEITSASQAYQWAVRDAGQKLRAECLGVLGHGVVGVHFDVEFERHFVNAVLVGTAVSPVGDHHAPGVPFVSDLSGRDFALLHQAGWDPVGLAAGASFVYAPRRSARDAVRQTAQNVELTNYTEALYSARESAMERMQQTASQLGAHGVVGVSVSEGPMEFAAHAVRFAAWGTAVRRSERQPVLAPPVMVLDLDDERLAFDPTSLRAAR
ncbi:MAG: heavy metal-binding domain-containing protein [Actinomycetota bacterium]|nr:heavy metal-binding domain-containing protein [Actinomycetota bacterium]